MTFWYQAFNRIQHARVVSQLEQRAGKQVVLESKIRGCHSSLRFDALHVPLQEGRLSWREAWDGMNIAVGPKVVHLLLCQGVGDVGPLCAHGATQVLLQRSIWRQLSNGAGWQGFHEHNLGHQCGDSRVDKCSMSISSVTPGCTVTSETGRSLNWSRPNAS